MPIASDGLKVSANVRNERVDANTLRNLVMVRCPTLVPGQTKMMFWAASEVNPNVGVNTLTMSLNEVDATGKFLGNIAFWVTDNPVPNRRTPFSFQWLYDPRAAGGTHPADVDLGTGAGKYLAFAARPQGAACWCRSSSLHVVAGDIEAITNDETTGSDLLNDSQDL